MPQLRPRMCHWLVPVCAAVATLALPVTGTAQSAAAGQWKSSEQIYGSTCAYCHETHVAPRLFGRRLAPEYVKHVVQSGQRAMPAFRPTDFTAAELDALARMIAAGSTPPASAVVQRAAVGGGQ